ncbi:MAG: DUF2249 domain-containing protein [Thiogranum sp.]|nr:DUF2249 domain-containing protein [Thiogranum sp.]
MKTRHLDVQGLEAPEPLDCILAELETLPDDTRLIVRHWREPLLLYPLLEAQGWQYQTVYDEQARNYQITICRAEV